MTQIQIKKLKYGNTNTYFLGGLLIDTDMAGSLPEFRRELKRQGIPTEDIKYILATHYHPDHIGLIGQLMQNGAKLILLDFQKDFVHSSDEIYGRMKNSGFVPIDENKAIIITCEESRDFLAKIGISGEVIHTESHSPDGAALILDGGNAIVGDLEPYGFIDGYDDNQKLRDDWNKLIRRGTRTVYPGHANEFRI